MKIMFSIKTLERILSAYLVAVIVITSFPAPVWGSEEATNLTINLTANGAKEVTIASNETFTIALSSDGATACELVSPFSSGISLSTSMNIEPGHPWYPVEGGSALFSVVCYDALDNSITDSAIVNVAAAPVDPEPPVDPVDPEPENPAPTTAPTTDIKVNDADGTVTITNGTSYTYSWNSTDATACAITSPTGESGISLSGIGAPIEPGHPWYPTVSSSVTLTINCSNAGTQTATDSVVVSLKPTVIDPPTPTPAPTADIKVNDSDGPVAIDNGTSYVYSWTSTNATACALTSPTGESGISLSGTGAAIEPGHPWYPTTSNPVTLTLTCSNAGTETAIDSVVVKIKDSGTPPNPPPPVNNSCPAPSSLGDTTSDVVGQSYGGGEKSLQAILNDAGYSLNVSDNQKQFQTWNVNSGNRVIINPARLVESVTARPSLFGYYTDDSMANFVPIFKTGHIAGYESLPFASSGPVVVTINNSTKISFAIKTFGAEGVAAGNFSTENSLNAGGVDHVLVFNPSANKYVLAFEDLAGGDFDYQDLVVEISFSCETVPPTPTPAPTADIKVNDSDGPVAIDNGTSYVYSWTSTNATACALTSPTGESGISLSGTGAAIEPGHPWYPTTSNPVTLTLTCSNAGTETAIDSVVVKIRDTDTPPPPTPKAVLNVKSSVASSVVIERVSGPSDIGGTTDYTRSYNEGIDAALEAPATVGNNTFLNWSGCDSVTGAGDRTCVVSVELRENKSVTANYKAPGNGGGPGPSCPKPEITSSLTASVTVNEAFSYTINATTTTATTTTFSINNSDLPDGLSFATSTGVISGTPTETGTFNINISAINDCGADNETLVITVNAVNPPGGGGGGGGGRGRGGSSRPPVTAGECFYLRDYMRRDFDNDPMEVLKLQAFLINFEGHSNVSLTGVFDQATFDAVSEFQLDYFTDILEPWGHTDSTGYVYILTLKKVNEIYCQRLFPLNEAQINEIIAFRALLESLRARGVDVQLPPSFNEGENGSTTTPIDLLPIVGEAEDDQGQNLSFLAGVIFAQPETLLELAKCLYQWLLIIFVLYVLGNVLKNVLYKDVPENTRKRFFAQWLTMDIGLVVAIIVAYLLGWWCLILPLFIAFVISSIWTLTYPKHNSIRASVKSWYLVVVARTKSFFRGNPPSLNAPIITVDKPVDNKVTPEQEGDVTVVSIDEEPKK